MGQVKTYIANKVNRIVALVNAARRLRNQPPYVRKPKLSGVQFGGFQVGGIGMITSNDISQSMAQNIGSVIQRANEVGGLDKSAETIISQGTVQEFRQNFTAQSGVNDLSQLQGKLPLTQQPS